MSYSYASLCTDINECVSSNGGCQHNCTNTVGSYYCTCIDSVRYTLSEDGHSCIGKLDYSIYIFYFNL